MWHRTTLIEHDFPIPPIPDTNFLRTDFGTSLLIALLDVQEYNYLTYYFDYMQFHKKHVFFMYI